MKSINQIEKLITDNIFYCIWFPNINEMLSNQKEKERKMIAITFLLILCFIFPPLVVPICFQFICINETTKKYLFIFQIFIILGTFFVWFPGSVMSFFSFTYLLFSFMEFTYKN
jgi:hypothetical protein